MPATRAANLSPVRIAHVTGRLTPAPRSSAAVAVRVAAFVVALASVIAVPATVAAALLGHVRAGSALDFAICAATLTLAFAVFARTLDPLRR